MCLLVLWWLSWERIETGIRRLVDVETRDVSCDVVLLVLVGGDYQVQQVALGPEVVWRGVPRRYGDGFDRLGRGLFSGRQQVLDSA